MGDAGWEGDERAGSGLQPIETDLDAEHEVELDCIGHLDLSIGSACNLFRIVLSRNAGKYGIRLSRLFYRRYR